MRIVFEQIFLLNTHAGLGLPDRLAMKLFHEIYGAGKPLVLIPGFASGAWIWFRQVEDLASSFQVVAFDPPGISRSSISDGTTVSLQDIVRDTAGLLDELKIDVP